MLPTNHTAIPPMSLDDIEKVRQAEAHLKTLDQVQIHTQHLIHGGIYARTIVIPSGVLLTGALIKRATTLIVSGYVTAYIGGKEITLEGYHVLPASANRKQLFFAHTDTHLTMLFPTAATSIEQAEAEFTDELDSLMSRHDQDSNHILITGE